jgi:hypothetical protein
MGDAGRKGECVAVGGEWGCGNAGEGRRPGSGNLMMPMTSLSMMSQGTEQGMAGNGGAIPPQHPMGNGLMNGHLGGGGMGGAPLGSAPMGSGPMGNLMSSMPMAGGGMLGGGPLGTSPMMGNGYMGGGGQGMGALPMGMMGMDNGGDGIPMGGLSAGSMPQVPMPMANGGPAPFTASTCSCQCAITSTPASREKL